MHDFCIVGGAYFVIAGILRMHKKIKDFLDYNLFPGGFLSCASFKENFNGI
jgi:hypothetical protein